MIDRFRALPMTRSAVLAGRTTADAVRNLFVLALMTGVATAIGFRFHAGTSAALVAVGLAVAVGVAFSWIFALLGLVVRDSESAGIGGLLAVIPLIFTSSIFVPVATFPGWLQAFAKVNPITVIVDALRVLCLGGPTATPVWHALAWVGGLLAVSVPAAVLSATGGPRPHEHSVLRSRASYGGIMSREQVDVLVVGAGPTGLCLAAALAAHGVRPRLIDRAHDRAHESRALAIQPRTLEVLAGLGITAQLVECGNRTVQLRLHARGHETAAPLFDFGLADTAYPYLLFLSQAETERIVGENLSAAGIAVERGVELTGLTPERGSVTATLRHPDGRTETVDGRLRDRLRRRTQQRADRWRASPSRAAPTHRPSCWPMPKPTASDPTRPTRSWRIRACCSSFHSAHPPAGGCWSCARPATSPRPTPRSPSTRSKRSPTPTRTARSGCMTRCG